ncbi:calmodulin-binding protein 25-like [Phragmites australis]|uniref:calmodulin-binding protein 25-like n=1 Tax=Phragmites australis TaxID=29695 RepID=UPI002D793946|nr:calmodulin-binding protein 25-like [Phragmites australis]
MLMTAMHMDSTHGHAPSSSSATTTPPPWLPADHHGLLYDFAASAPSPSPPPATVPLHRHLRSVAPSARRVAKRRARPSRRLPTTYISTDPASFRRVVHQVTGADDLPLPPPDLLCRPVPARADSAAPGALTLPTLDTSAFLLGGPARADAPCDGSAALAPADGLGGGPYQSATNCGFPTLESWDTLF